MEIRLSGIEINMRHIDSDSLLSLGKQAVGCQRKKSKLIVSHVPSNSLIAYTSIIPVFEHSVQLV